MPRYCGSSARQCDLEAFAGRATYSPNLLNQYTSRTNPHKIEVSGYSPATTVLVNSQEATRFRNSMGNLLYDGFFHKQLSDTESGPEKVGVQPPTILNEDVPSIVESTVSGA